MCPQCGHVTKPPSTPPFPWQIGQTFFLSTGIFKLVVVYKLVKGRIFLIRIEFPFLLGFPTTPGFPLDKSKLPD